MNKTETKLPIKAEKSDTATVGTPMHSLSALRREFDRLFDAIPAAWRFPSDFSKFGMSSLFANDGFDMSPAVDIVEKDKAYEVTAELPGLDEKNIEVKVVDDMLTIKGEKKDEKEEKGKDHYLRERRYGSFQRMFRVPAGVDADHIEARFAKGVLTVVLPKRPEAAKAEKAEKKIAIKAG